MVRGAEDVAAALACGFETAAHLRAGLFGRASFKEVKLIEAADHAHAAAHAPFGLGQVHIPAHLRRRERFHRVGAHVCDAFQERHHPAAGVVGDALPGLVRN